MHMMYFTEQPMAAYDAKAGLDYRRDRADVSPTNTSIRMKAAGCTTSIWKNTSWPRNPAPTVSC